MFNVLWQRSGCRVSIEVGRVSVVAAVSIMFHPSSLLLLWGSGLIALQGLDPISLTVIATLLAGFAFRIDGLVFRRMIARSRWLFLSMIVLFALMTPGVRWQGALGGLGVTYEGALAAWVNCLRLLAMLALVVILICTMGRIRLVIALVGLARPLAWLGLDAQTLAVRLALTLEEVAGNQRASWREYLEAPAVGEGGALKLERIEWRWMDSLVTAGVFALAATIWGLTT